MKWTLVTTVPVDRVRVVFIISVNRYRSGSRCEIVFLVPEDHVEFCVPSYECPIRSEIEVPISIKAKGAGLRIIEADTDDNSALSGV